METINDIVRKVAVEMINTSMQEITAETIHGWATRLGDAATCEKSSQVGNAAKMRKALLEIHNLLKDRLAGKILLVSMELRIKNIINAALSALARNCDRLLDSATAIKSYQEETGLNKHPVPLWTAAQIYAFIDWLFAEAKGE